MSMPTRPSLPHPESQHTPEGVRAAVKRALKAGLNVVPPAEDGSKAPIGPRWAHFQARKATTEEYAAWYSSPGEQRHGLGVVCGAISGNLEMLEFDDLAAYEAFKTAADAVGLGDLVKRIEAGYSEQTPGDGVHWFYRCDTIAGNTKLAQRPKKAQEMQHQNDKVKVLIETRGEHGFAILAPSHGPVHPSGKPYRVRAGGFETIATITPEERESLWDLARTLDQMPRPLDTSVPKSLVIAGARPGDDFILRTTWAEVLEPHGWALVYQRGEEQFWRRPGKARGVSATTNYRGNDLLYIFSTSTEFEAERGYNRFSVYSLLNHGGDFQSAARQLAAEGYGQRSGQGGSELNNLPVPPYPVSVLPEHARHLVDEGAAAVGVPPEMVALPFLAATGAVIGNRISIRVKEGFVQYAILWCGVVAVPGAAKSPAEDAATSPMRQLQSDAYTQWDAAKVLFEEDMAVWQAAEKSDRGPKPLPPDLEHYFTTDATVEALSRILTGSPGVLLLRDELVGWVLEFDQYKGGGKGGERQRHLSAWAGKAWKVDRKSAEPVLIDHPVITVFGGIQPEMLPLLQAEAGRRDGFLERFLWSFPLTEPANWSEAIVDPITAEQVTKDFRLLREAPVGTVTLSPEAKALWVTWFNSNAERTRHAAGLLQGTSAKMPIHVLRLTLILHCLAYPEGPAAMPVSESTLRGAIDLGDYHYAHAAKVFAVIGSKGTSPAGGGGLERVRSALAGSEWKDKTELLRGLHMRVDELDPLLDQLLAAGDAEHETERTTNPGRPREVYRGRPA